MKESYQRIVVVSIVMLIGAAVIFGMLALDRLERIANVAERTELKLDRIIEAGAPLGRVAVKKGTAALENVDADDLGKSTTNGLKEIGSAAKKRLIEHIEKKKSTEDNNAQQTGDGPVGPNP